ncbi:MAG: HetP family heterocyst commitment protein [Richelia sp. RM2_1_2]|nr:HetP family heterocyst commitment protein [Richelia sp. SM2_1_7]NJM19025.1 HetP family heterocyst commitment protein [Richelia sp. SM1_7_0]NJN08831.1 HetP family heterocyst commitment protein [Richelia sp. RM1_1_1]NJO29724.1 HetP family heterocyst commitment protein [Richelia sp. SL_2_1]NJO59085.1 HetP family heterocyst commitment protein [Richelia sp. RM2_1_2]
MNQDFSGISGNLDKAIHSEQFDQVVEAILAGKYSWACVLMLRFAGYNPLHYIPYRTYNRLIKEHSPKKSNLQSNENINTAKQNHHKRKDGNMSPSCLNKIKDLAYLEVVGKQKTEIRGGSNIDRWLETQVREYQSMKSDFHPEEKRDLQLNFCKFN